MTYTCTGCLTNYHPTLTDHRSKFAKKGKRKMCSFGSCQTRFEFLSQFRKVRNAFECFVTQVQTRLPKTKCVLPMKINVMCTVRCIFITNQYSTNKRYLDISWFAFGIQYIWDMMLFVSASWFPSDVVLTKPIIPTFIILGGLQQT